MKTRSAAGRRVVDSGSVGEVRVRVCCGANAPFQPENEPDSVFLSELGVSPRVTPTEEPVKRCPLRQGRFVGTRQQNAPGGGPTLVGVHLVPGVGQEEAGAGSRAGGVCDFCPQPCPPALPISLTSVPRDWAPSPLEGPPPEHFLNSPNLPRAHPTIFMVPFGPWATGKEGHGERPRRVLVPPIWVGISGHSDRLSIFFLLLLKG